MTLAAEVAILIPENPQKVIEIFIEILEEIRRVKYYRPWRQRPSQPRVTKRPKNKWIENKRRKMENH